MFTRKSNLRDIGRGFAPRMPRPDEMSVFVVGGPAVNVGVNGLGCRLWCARHCLSRRMVRELTFQIAEISAMVGVLQLPRDLRVLGLLTTAPHVAVPSRCASPNRYFTTHLNRPATPPKTVNKEIWTKARHNWRECTSHLATGTRMGTHQI